MLSWGHRPRTAVALALGEDEDPGISQDGLASLKRAFYATSASSCKEDELDPSTQAAPTAGILRDMPLCRWPWEILPHHQKVLIVHEPQYILLFEQLLATPPPHDYVHLLLQNGTRSFGQPEYALRPGSKAPFAGTLMRIGAHVRCDEVTASDGATVPGLVLIVQGLARVQVLKEVQAVPYSRADVLLAPDVEALRASAHLSRRWLRRTGLLSQTGEATRVRLALAGATAEEAYWRRLELTDAPVAKAGPTPKLCALNATHNDGSSTAAAKCAMEAMEATSLTVADETDIKAEAAKAAEDEMQEAGDVVATPEEGAASQAASLDDDDTLASFLGADNVDAGYRNASAWHTKWLRSLLDAIEDTAIEGEAQLRRQLAQGVVTAVGVQQLTSQASAVDENEAAEDARALLDLERQVWLELDNLVNPDGERGDGALLSAFMTDADVPLELLALLPPPPESGWPVSFGLGRRAESVRARAQLEALVSAPTQLEALMSPPPAAAVGENYPLLRRAERLSYAVWTVIGAEEDAPLQRVLEATSTSERLRFAVLRCRRMTGRSFRPSGGAT